MSPLLRRSSSKRGNRKSKAPDDVSTPSADSDVPSAQLRLIHDELNRQRDLTHKRHDAMRTRAIFLAGTAAAVLAGQSSRIQPSSSVLFRVATGSINFSDFLAWLPAAFALLAVLCALAAACYGVACLRAEYGPEINATTFAVNALGDGVDPYSAEWALVGDKLAVHNDDNKRLEKLRKTFHTGGTFLVVSWILVILQFGATPPGDTVGKDQTPPPRVQLPSPPQQQLPTNISMVVKESGVPVETRNTGQGQPPAQK